MTRAGAAEEHARALSVLRAAASAAAAETSTTTCLDNASSSVSSSRFRDVVSAHARSLKAQREALDFALSFAEGEAAFAENEVSDFAQGQERVRFSFFSFQKSLSLVFSSLTLDIKNCGKSLRTGFTLSTPPRRGPRGASRPPARP